MHPIQVTTEGNKTTIVFNGEGFDRDDFVSEARLFIHNYFGQSERSFYNPLVYIFRELIKNLYDHGIAKGSLEMIDTEEYFQFSLIDDNDKLFDFAKIKSGTNWVKKSGKNFHVGVSTVIDICETHGITLTVDDTKGGLNYFGNYPKKNKIEH